MDQREISRDNSGAMILTRVFAILLFTSGALKVVAALRGRFTPIYFLPDWMHQNALVGPGEVLIGLIACIIGSQLLILVMLSMCFSVFLMISVREAVEKLPTCGCFGSLHVPPVFAASLDLVALVSLSLAYHRALRLRACTTTAALVGISITLGVVFARRLQALPITSQQTSAIADADAAGEVVVIDPSGWLGAKLPIMDAIVSAPPRLQWEDWTLILYRRDCDDCQRLLSYYSAGHRLPYDSSDSNNRMLLDLASPRLSNSAPEETWASRGQLNPRKLWFAETPIVIQTHKGVVAHVYLRDAVLNSLKE